MSPLSSPERLDGIYAHSPHLPSLAQYARLLDFNASMLSASGNEVKKKVAREQLKSPRFMLITERR
jgi:hypothetical protein